MKKTQKKYDNRESILEAIDTTKANMHANSVKADEAELKSKKQFKTAATLKGRDANEMILFARDNQALADKLRKRVNRSQNRLQRLKHTLAVFDTEIMPGVVEDKSVVFQP